MNKKIGGLMLALAAIASMAASSARAERFELTFTGTLTQMRASVGCSISDGSACDFQQGLAPVAPISFTRSIVFEIGGPGMGGTGTYVLDATSDWSGRPMRYELGDQSMGTLSSNAPVSPALLPADLLTRAQVTAPAAIDGSYVSAFHSRAVSTYLDAVGGESRTDLWGVNESVVWTDANSKTVGLMFQVMQSMPFPVTHENIGEALSVNDFIARMNEDFWCQGCTQEAVATATVWSGNTVSDYVYFGSVGAFNLRQLDASAVPEPSTYALMLAGVAAIGIAARRRRAEGGRA